MKIRVEDVINDMNRIMIYIVCALPPLFYFLISESTSKALWSLFFGCFMTIVAIQARRLYDKYVSYGGHSEEENHL